MFAKWVTDSTKKKNKNILSVFCQNIDIGKDRKKLAVASAVTLKFKIIFRCYRILVFQAWASNF